MSICRGSTFVTKVASVHLLVLPTHWMYLYRVYDLINVNTHSKDARSLKRHKKVVLSGLKLMGPSWSRNIQDIGRIGRVIRPICFRYFRPHTALLQLLPRAFQRFRTTRAILNSNDLSVGFFFKHPLECP